MIVYRITLAIHSMKLLASGYPARWNSKDVKMIYTAQSRALACLENVVHRNSKGLQNNFRVMQIFVPDDMVLMEIKETDLLKGWKKFDKFPYTQSLGDQWIHEAKSGILKIPSAIVSGDSNYLINPEHKDFKKVKLLKTEPFEFDGRIKENL
ncbi:MAG: RES family NAD+ phosphorylase [Ginsengibacter sp.]